MQPPLSLDVSRIRLEGRLATLEAAPARYATMTRRRVVDWTDSDLQAFSELEAATTDTIAALERLFPGAPLPAPERALTEQVEHARGGFLVDLHRRLLGVETHWRNIDVPRLMLALREAREIAAAPLNSQPRGALTQGAGWTLSLGRQFEPCVLGRSGLLVGERLIPRENLCVVFSGRGRGGGEWRIEPDVLLAGDGVAGEIQRLVRLMDDLEHRSFTAKPTPSSPIFVGTDLTVTPRTHVVLITEAGLFHLPMGSLFGTSLPGFLSVLAALPGSHLLEWLDDLVRRDGEYLPAADLASAEPVFDGDRLRLRWRDAMLEIQFTTGEAKRVSQFLRLPQ